MNRGKGILGSRMQSRGRSDEEKLSTPEHLMVRNEQKATPLEDVINEILYDASAGLGREAFLGPYVDRHKGDTTTCRVPKPVNALIDLHRLRNGYKSKQIAVLDLVLLGVQDHYFNKETAEILARIQYDHEYQTIGEAIEHVVREYSKK